MLARMAKGCLKSLTIVGDDEESLCEGSLLSWIASVSQNLEHLTILEGQERYHSNFRLEAASLSPYLQELHLTGSRDFPPMSDCIVRCQGGFRFLEVLHLQSSTMTEDSLTQLVGLCPSLQELELEGLNGIDHIRLESSTLTYVVLTPNEGPEDDLSSEEGFLGITLTMPALQKLVVGGLLNSLKVVDAPLENLRLQGCHKNLAVDLGRNAALQSLIVRPNSWPPDGTSPTKRSPFGSFLTLLELAKPAGLRLLIMPFIDYTEQLSWDKASQFIEHIQGLEILNFPASFSAACGLGSPPDEGIGGHVQRLLREHTFTNLKTICYFLDVNTPESFELVQSIASCSQNLKRVTIFAPSQATFGPGNLVSLLLRFQRLNPQIIVNYQGINTFG